jgi:hypothetical protein
MSYGSYAASAPPHYFVSRVPDGWPSALIPEAASVVGGMNRGSALSAVFAYPGNSADALRTYRQLLDRAGWKRPVMERAASGFQSNGDSFSYYCRDSAHVSVVPITGTPSSSYVHVSIQIDRGHACAERERGAWTPDLTLPALTAPQGVQMTVTHGSGSTDQIESGARLVDAAMTPGALVAHYGAQLAAAGWTVSVPLANERIATQTLDARDKNGKTWTGAITAIARGPDREVWLRMLRIGE